MASGRGPRGWFGPGFTLTVILAASALAVGAARPFAGCWNDGSRLATVECLIDHHTLAIDKSVFVRVPQPPAPAPYPASEPGLLQHGTLDKLFIQGHYYSDKSPVPAVLLAGVYQFWQWATGWTARTHPQAFCYFLTLASSGLAYVVAVLAIFRLACRLRLRPLLALSLTGSFALATVALPYARQTNNHILLLAVAAELTVQASALAQRQRTGRVDTRRVALMGMLAGLAYTIDLGTGPVLLVCTGLLVAFRTRRWQALAAFLGAALPCSVLHHTLNYRVGGSWRPANALSEHFLWPGSPFRPNNLTGGWVHHNLGSFGLYTASLLLGKRGFIGHNLPLFLLFPLAWRWFRGRWRARPEVWWALGCCAGPWLLYAMTSNNSSGQCLSIRWFVPLLAPAYYLLALILRARKSGRAEFLLLSGWGLLLAALMGEGPWSKSMVPFFWPIQAAALLSWAGLRQLQHAPIPLASRIDPRGSITRGQLPLPKHATEFSAESEKVRQQVGSRAAI